MNIFDKFLLNFFLLSGPLLQKMNVNLDHLRAILIAKLTIDNRRPAPFQQMRGTNENKKINHATLITMLMSFFMGLLMLTSLNIGNDLVTKLTFFFSMFIFILAATMISDFTSVLIDTRDNQIILPKPVNDPTFVASRLIHIVIHINKLLLPMALPTLAGLIILKGPETIIPFILMVLFATLLSIFIVNALYILILKFTKPSKFQTVISYFQIGFAIFIYGGYQIIPRMISGLGTDDIDISNFQYIIYYPPYWFAQACNSLSNLTFNSLGIYMLILAIITPVLSILAVIKYFAPAFTSNLSKIISGSSESKMRPAQYQITGNNKLSGFSKLAKLLTADNYEYIGFLFTWKMMVRSRDFKLKVYPGIGYLIVILAMMFFNSDFSFYDIKEMNSSGKRLFLVIIYISSFVYLTALSQIPYSDKYKAAWLFAISPLQKPGNILSGAVKSVMFFFYIPLVLLISIFGIYLGGISIIPNLILGCFIVLTIGAVMALINLNELPFTVSAENASKGRNFSRNIISITFIAIPGIIHWLIFDQTWLIIIAAILSILISWLVMKKIKNTGWSKINSFNRLGFH